MKRFVAHIRSGRGFVILVVMLLLAVATAVAMSQFSVGILSDRVYLFYPTVVVDARIHVMSHFK